MTNSRGSDELSIRLEPQEVFPTLVSVQLVLKISTYLPPGCDGGRLLGGDPVAVGHSALPPLQKEALSSLSLSSGAVIFFTNNLLSKLSASLDSLKLFLKPLPDWFEAL